MEKKNPITHSMLIKCATNAKHKDKNNSKKFLESITHLSLDNKKIGGIACLNECPNLTVLYLFENQIKSIQGIETLNKLVQLSLYNN